jgi:hypothetical protein
MPGEPHQPKKNEHHNQHTRAARPRGLGGFDPLRQDGNTRGKRRDKPRRLNPTSGWWRETILTRHRDKPRERAAAFRGRALAARSRAVFSYPALILHPRACCPREAGRTSQGMVRPIAAPGNRVRP